MKQNILGTSPTKYHRRLYRHIALCAVLAALTLLLNILLTLMLTPENRTLLLWLNVGSDALCGCFVVYRFTRHISRQQKLYRLSVGRGVPCLGTVTHISERTVRHMDLDCLDVTVGERRLFLPAQTISLEIGKPYHFLTTSGVITEAEA